MTTYVKGYLQQKIQDLENLLDDVERLLPDSPDDTVKHYLNRAVLDLDEAFYNLSDAVQYLK